MRRVLSIEKPENPLPVVFDSPHSGHDYPADFNPACPIGELHTAEDMYVDELFAEAPAHRAPFLKALFPRSYIDPNRAADDIDPTLLDGAWPADTYGPINPSRRSDAGIGLIRRLLTPGKPLYNRSLSAAEIMARIDGYYRPYHTALEELLDEAHYNYGQVWHINCHSMPASTATPHKPHSLYLGQPRTLDIVLGDRSGTTCGRNFVHAVRDMFRDMGYNVGVNDPFKGAELIKRYAQPTRGRHSLQIEINKALYMNESTFTKTDNFLALKGDLSNFIAFCTDWAQAQNKTLAAD
ncbi:MAG: N-formylglutamate amidohydrolase [Alphaproteobacteria bacterium]|nr:N-formylglutamate amidohydrolase [Alphaproteobacteria bacterium]MCD8526159.1 N-formylglutamate amidohydrolase [Alphaproteobacteria bacterium]